MRKYLLAILLLFAACTGSASVQVQLRLVFAPEPTGALQGQVLPTFQVRIEDAVTGVVLDLAGTVSLTIDTNPTGGLAPLLGTTARPLSNGTATFDDISIGVPGNGFTLRAQVTGATATDAVSQTFDIRPQFEVVSFNLIPSSSNVPLNKVLEITFSGTVAVTSVDSDSIKITDLTTNVGVPPQGQYLVFGNIVRFEPTIPQTTDFADAGFLPGTIYSIGVPVIPGAGVKSTRGDLLATPFSDAFATVDPAFLPMPGDLDHPSNHSQLNKFFEDEGIENGTVPCPRAQLPAADRDSPQFLRSIPSTNATGVGIVRGSSGGTTYVQLPFLSIQFSEPYGPWRANAVNVVVRNTDTNATYDLQFTITQNRFFSELAIQVLDLGSPFMTDTVPAGNYAIELTGFEDLGGNLLVNPDTCTADGTCTIVFATAS